MPLDMYAENLIRHYEKPHNKGKMEDSSASMHEDNPSCGDEIDLYIKIEDGKVRDVKFEGSGCAISMGSASILTDFIKGKALGDIEGLGKEELFGIIGIDPGAARLHCATLSLKAVKKAVLEYGHKGIDEKTKRL